MCATKRVVYNNWGEVSILNIRKCFGIFSLFGWSGWVFLFCLFSGFRELQPHTIHWPYKYPLKESGKLLPLRTTQHPNYFISWKFSCYFTLYSEQDPYCTIMIYSSGSKKGYHRGLGHVGERLEQKIGNESVLEVTEKWMLNTIDCKKRLASFYIHRCELIVDITTLDNSMFEKSYFRKFNFLLYTQEPPMLNSKLSKTVFFCEVRWISSVPYVSLSADMYSKVQYQQEKAKCLFNYRNIKKWKHV